MNKQELVSAIAKEAGLTKVAAEKSVNALVKAVSGSLKKGNAVQLIGFGTFSVSKRAARTGRNPQTGKEIKIAAKKVAKFKAGKALSDLVKQFLLNNRKKEDSSESFFFDSIRTDTPKCLIVNKGQGICGANSSPNKVLSS